MWTAIRACATAAAATIGFASGAWSAECISDSFEDTPFVACTVEPATDDLRLWHVGPDGQVLGTFQRVNTLLADEGKTLGFAMNGAMYHPDRSPVGLYVENGRETSPLVTSDGPGNFGLLPNGVFCVSENGALIMETRAFADAAPECRFAMQSGPLLVQDGALHPKLIPDGTSVNIRNGVGVRPDGSVVFAISDVPVNFHRFARLFRDRLGARDALYIDGSTSRLFLPELGRRDLGLPMGPIVGVAVPVN